MAYDDVLGKVEQHPAFWAAYNAMSPRVGLAQVRQEVASQVVATIAERRRYAGMGYALLLAESPTAREPVVREVYGALPEVWTSCTRAAVDDAVRAAAAKLAEG